MPRSRTASSGFASRAAARASSVLIDAVSLMIPNHPSPSPSIRRSQSSECCSSSVALGLVFQSIPLTLSAAVSSSARIPGADPVVAK
jgi:hypothetical protein